MSQMSEPDPSAPLPGGWSAPDTNRPGLDQKNVVRGADARAGRRLREPKLGAPAPNCRLKRPGLRRARSCPTALRRPRGTTGEA